MTTIVTNEVHMRQWQINEAKAKFSEFLKAAVSDGPQQVTFHGKAVAVLLSQSEFEGLIGTGESFADFMLRSPLSGLEEFNVERPQGRVRKAVEL